MKIPTWELDIAPLVVPVGMASVSRPGWAGGYIVPIEWLEDSDFIAALKRGLGGPRTCNEGGA